VELVTLQSYGCEPESRRRKDYSTYGSGFVRVEHKLHSRSQPPLVSGELLKYLHEH